MHKEKILKQIIQSLSRSYSRASRIGKSYRCKIKTEYGDIFVSLNTDTNWKIYACIDVYEVGVRPDGSIYLSNGAAEFVIVDKKIPSDIYDWFSLGDLAIFKLIADEIERFVKQPEVYV